MGNYRAVAGLVLAAWLFHTAALAQNYPLGTLGSAVYHRDAGTQVPFMGTIDGNRLTMEKTYYVNGSAVTIRVEGEIKAKALRYVVTFEAKNPDKICTAAGTMPVDGVMIDITLDPMLPDDSFCRRPSGSSSKRRLVLQLLSAN
jgi:hypothetical protein